MLVYNGKYMKTPSMEIYEGGTYYVVPMVQCGKNQVRILVSNGFNHCVLSYENLESFMENWSLPVCKQAKYCNISEDCK